MSINTATRLNMQTNESSDAQAIDELLAQHERHSTFARIRNIYPRIVEARNRGIKYAQISDQLRRVNLIVSPATLSRYVKRIRDQQAKTRLHEEGTRLQAEPRLSKSAALPTPPETRLHGKGTGSQAEPRLSEPVARPAPPDDGQAHRVLTHGEPGNEALETPERQMSLYDRAQAEVDRQMKATPRRSVTAEIQAKIEAYKRRSDGQSS